MKMIIKKICVWIPVIAIMLCIFSFSNQTGEQSMGLSRKVSEILVDFADGIHLIDMKWNDREHAIEQMQTPVRKLAHAAEYFILAMAVYFALKYDGFFYRFTKYLTFIIVLGYACLDEFHQLYTAGRYGSAKDVAIDMCGCLVAVIISVILDKRKNIII